MTGDDDTTQSTTQQAEDEMTEAEIDKNLQDTFPASDPPSWTLGTNHKSSPVKDGSDEDEPPHR